MGFWKRDEAKKQAAQYGGNPGFDLPAGLSISQNKAWQDEMVFVRTSEVCYLTEDEIERNYDVIGRGKDGELIVRRK